MTSEYIERTKGWIIQTKLSATFGYALAMGASIGAVVSESPVSYLVLTAFGTLVSVANGVVSGRLEDDLKAAESAESNSLEAKLKAKRESELLEDMAILSKRCKLKDKYM
ncbi:MAG: hypothetical protein WC852_05305 [Candidatus Nanoarchaeia archaeon]|jgi:hypothetical protein